MKVASEVPQIENIPSACEKATEKETAINGLVVNNLTDNDTEKLYEHIWSIIKKMSLIKKLFLQLLKMFWESWQV